MPQRTCSTPGAHRLAVAAVLLLCICVVMQILGAPVTLLNPHSDSDPLTLSVSEGFTLQSVRPQVPIAAQAVMTGEAPLLPHTPVLAATLFHPPVS